MQCTYWIKNNKVGPMQQIKSVKNIIKHNMLSVVKEIIKLNKTKKKITNMDSLWDAESNLCVAGSNGPVKECEAHVFIGT